jgi:hypothetical protein
MRSHELFRKYISDREIIRIVKSGTTRKKHLFLNQTITKVDDHFLHPLRARLHNTD